MLWILLSTAVAFCGIAVLGVLGIRVYVAAARLARQVGDSSQALATAAEHLQRSAEPLAARAGATLRARDEGRPKVG